MGLEESIGQFFIFGFSGKKVGSDTKELVKKYKPGGLILFPDNYQTPAQLRELIKELSCLSRPSSLLFAVDQEGGRVTRLSRPFTQFPGNEALGVLEPRQHLGVELRGKLGRGKKVNQNDWHSPSRSMTRFMEYERRVRKTVRLAYLQGEVLARELREVGIHWNLAPVLDLNNPRSQVLKGRCLGRSPEWVSEIGLALIAGMQDNGVLACGKHFPGHGVTAEDSHKKLPYSEVSSEVVLRDHIRPFQRAMANGLRSIMLAHVVYPGLDSELPASLSEKIGEEIIRKSLEYDGLVITDDLGMGAIRKNYGIADAACLAFRAGVDMLLVVRDINYQIEAYEAVRKSWEGGKISSGRLEQSLHRIWREKKYLEEYQNRQSSKERIQIGCRDHRRIAQEISALPSLKDGI